MADRMSLSQALPRPELPSEEDGPSLRVHEAVCAERYVNILRLLESTTRRVARLEVLVVIVACSVISGMSGIIVTLAVKLGAH
jgi:hypothetical protein